MKKYFLFLNVYPRLIFCRDEDLHIYTVLDVEI